MKRRASVENLISLFNECDWPTHSGLQRYMLYSGACGASAEAAICHQCNVFSHPHADFIDGPRDCMGEKLEDETRGFDMTLITQKTMSQTKSRTGGNCWLQALYPKTRTRCHRLMQQG
jgi:hypothetical protein